MSITAAGDVRRHTMATALRVFLFWAAAAGIVVTCRTNSVAAIAAIVGAAFVYTHVCAKQAGVAHALGVGIAWLVMAIVAEIVISGWLGRGWYALIGSPERPLLRNVFLFVWVFAPALFAQREAER
ncbi:MAG TPA: hypothetical protein VGR02_21130 [Thermoanaerobaculia bacterium]|nr:hypothetical protein [Thermoanaerobaculia bacterium]